MFNFAFKSERNLKSSFMGQDIGVQDGPTIRQLSNKQKRA